MLIKEARNFFWIPVAEIERENIHTKSGQYDFDVSASWLKKSCQLESKKESRIGSKQHEIKLDLFIYFLLKYILQFKWVCILSLC